MEASATDILDFELLDDFFVDDDALCFDSDDSMAESTIPSSGIYSQDGPFEDERYSKNFQYEAAGIGFQDAFSVDGDTALFDEFLDRPHHSSPLHQLKIEEDEELTLLDNFESCKAEDCFQTIPRKDTTMNDDSDGEEIEERLLSANSSVQALHIHRISIAGSI